MSKIQQQNVKNLKSSKPNSSKLKSLSLWEDGQCKKARTGVKLGPPVWQISSVCMCVCPCCVCVLVRPVLSCWFSAQSYLSFPHTVPIWHPLNTMGKFGPQEAYSGQGNILFHPPFCSFLLPPSSHCLLPREEIRWRKTKAKAFMSPLLNFEASMGVPASKPHPLVSVPLSKGQDSCTKCIPLEWQSCWRWWRNFYMLCVL